MPGQTTIRSPVRFSHRGLRSGKPASVRFRPGAADDGIVINGTMPARIANAFVEGHTVGLRGGGEAVMGVEHLLAACYGLEIDNLEVEITGDEVPFGDGSALPFTRVLQAAGRKTLEAPRRAQTLVRPVIAWFGDAFVLGLPAGDRLGLGVACRINFPGTPIGEQGCTFSCTPGDFLTEVSGARTFGCAADSRLLPSWLERSVTNRDGMLLPAKPRFTNEQVRHKTLDLIGDLCLLGRRLQARVFALQAGHRLHHEFVRKLEEEWI